MKKIILLFIAVLCICGDGICNMNLSYAIATQGRTIREIRIDVLTIGGGKPRPRPRSAQQEIEAELDLTTNQLFLEFNESVGRVTIEVKNSTGQVINSYSCDTEMEPVVIMGISDYADSYTINIVGKEIEAIGFYDTFDW